MAIHYNIDTAAPKLPTSRPPEFHDVVLLHTDDGTEYLASAAHLDSVIKSGGAWCDARVATQSPRGPWLTASSGFVVVALRTVKRVDLFKHGTKEAPDARWLGLDR